MAKTYSDGQMISGNAVDKQKVPVGTVIRYEPGGSFRGQCSLLTVNGWVTQESRFNNGKGHYMSTEKLFRILHVGNGNPEL
jgi:hypothetical protein